MKINQEAYDKYLPCSEQSIKRLADLEAQKQAILTWRTPLEVYDRTGKLVSLCLFAVNTQLPISYNYT